MEPTLNHLQLDRGLIYSLLTHTHGEFNRVIAPYAQRFIPLNQTTECKRGSELPHDSTAPELVEESLVTSANLSVGRTDVALRQRAGGP